MVSEELKQQINDPDIAASYFSGAKEKLTRRITYFDNNLYGSGINVYFMSKKTFDSAADALCVGWLMQFLWEEGEEEFDYSLKACKAVAEEFFAQDIQRYRYMPVNEYECKSYISSKIEPIVKATTKIQMDEKNPDKVEFLSKSGIYVDKAYTTKNAYLFKKDEAYKGGLVLFQEKQGSSKYREIFFETDSKYVLFLE